MAQPNEGKFASLRKLRHQRLDEDLLPENEIEAQAAPAETAKVEQQLGKKQPKAAKPAAVNATKRKPDSKPSKPAESSQKPKQSGPGRPRGRRSNPDYTQITAYVPLELYLDVQDELIRQKRELRTRSAKNASELIEDLLNEWLAKRKTK